MTIKELFDKAENGTLTYEQFVDAAGTAKFVDLSEGHYVSKQKFDDELANRDTRITSLTDTIAARDADLATLQQTLKDAGDLDALKSASSNLEALQKKYDDETKAYQAQLAKQAYEFAVKEFANGKKFTSNAAKRDFVQAMIAKDLKLENSHIIGAEDFVSMYSADNADAFAVENNDPEPQQTPKPQFVSPTSNSGGKEEQPDAFLTAFNFQGVRPIPKNE